MRMIKNFDFTKLYEDAVKRFKDMGVTIHNEDRIDFFAWPQMWGSTACGFGGLGGAAMTTAQTAVFRQAHSPGPLLVYIANRFAYQVLLPNETWYKALDRRNVLGAGQYKDQYEMET